MIRNLFVLTFVVAAVVGESYDAPKEVVAPKASYGAPAVPQCSPQTVTDTQYQTQTKLQQVIINPSNNLKHLRIKTQRVYWWRHLLGLILSLTSQVTLCQVDLSTLLGRTKNRGFYVANRGNAETWCFYSLFRNSIQVYTIYMNLTSCYNN